MTEVRIEKLSKRYGSSTAVDDISLTIAEGEFVSFLGPSGCGKTTTLKMIAGFEDVSSGSIFFDGQNIVGVPAEKRDIGMVFQNYALFPHMTVAQNLAFGLEMRRIPKHHIEQRAKRVLDMVQLSSFADRYPIQLSGGQQQRVALARALVIEPRILLLDEPLANLDAKLREEMRVFIRELQKRVGITTIYVTHDQAEAMSMSDKVVVIFGGRIAQAGPPSDIYDRPANLEVAQFVGQVNIVSGKVLEIRPDNRRLVSTPFGKLALDTGPAPVGGEILLTLRPEAIDLQIGLDNRQGGAACGSVVASYYSGSLIDYQVELDDRTILHVQMFPKPAFAIGQRVILTVAPENFWFIGDKK